MPCSEPEMFDSSDENDEEPTEQMGSAFNETYIDNLESEDPSSTSGETGENDMKVGKEVYDLSGSCVTKVIQILIATDIHVGYGENKGVIHDDSVNTLEEVLQIASKENVDFILLGKLSLYHLLI